MRAIDYLDGPIAQPDGVHVTRDNLGLRPGQGEEQLFQALGHVELQRVLAANDG